jgi:hypothetical protein
MVENTIADVQKLERSVDGKSLSDLQIRLALRCCLRELRMLNIDQVECRPSAPAEPAIPLKPYAHSKKHLAFD